VNPVTCWPVWLVKGNNMGAGGPGDHPLTDLLIHGIRRFPEDICILLEAIYSYEKNLLNEFDLEFNDWAEGKRLDEGRVALIAIISQNNIEPVLVNAQKELLKQSRCLYSQALIQKELRTVYFRFSKKLLLAAESKGSIPDSYNKQKTALIS